MGRGRQLWNRHNRTGVWILDSRFTPTNVSVCVQENYNYSQFVLTNLQTGKKVLSGNYMYTDNKKLKTTGTVNHIKRKAEYASISTSWLREIGIEITDEERDKLVNLRISYKYSDNLQKTRSQEKKEGMWIIIIENGIDIIPCRTKEEAERKQAKLGEGIIQFGKYEMEYDELQEK